MEVHVNQDRKKQKTAYIKIIQKLKTDLEEFGPSATQPSHFLFPLRLPHSLNAFGFRSRPSC